MRDHNRYVLVDHMEFREQAGYVPAEKFSWNAVERFRGGALNVAGACKTLILFHMDQKALWHFGLTREDYLISEVERLKDEKEDLEIENMRLQVALDNAV